MLITQLLGTRHSNGRVLPSEEQQQHHQPWMALCSLGHRQRRGCYRNNNLPSQLCLALSSGDVFVAHHTGNKS